MRWLDIFLDTVFEPSSLAERYRNPDVAWLKAHGKARSLLRVLNNRRCYDWPRKSAAEALAELGDRNAMPSLLRMVRDATQDVELRTAAAEALLKLGNAESPTILIEALRTETDSRTLQRIVGCLARMGNPVFSTISSLAQQTHPDYLDLVLRNMREKQMSVGDTRRFAQIMALLSRHESQTETETYTEEECWDIGNPWGSWVTVQKKRQNTTEWLEVLPDGELKAHAVVTQCRDMPDHDWDDMLAGFRGLDPNQALAKLGALVR